MTAIAAESETLEDWMAELPEELRDLLAEYLQEQRGKAFLQATQYARALMQGAVSLFLEEPDHEAAAWAVAHALELPICQGMSMRARSRALGHEQQETLSGLHREFRRGNSLPLTEYSKALETNLKLYQGALKRARGFKDRMRSWDKHRKDHSSTGGKTA